MSTKQAVIYTLMILMAGVMFFALGWWFKTSIELSRKTAQIDALKGRSEALRQQIENDGGLRFQVEDKSKGVGLQKLLDQATAEMTTALGDDTSGLGDARKLYTGMLEQIDSQWPVGQTAWKTTYDGWKEKNREIRELLTSSATEIKEQEKKVVSAKEELEAAVIAKETEDRRVIAERKRMGDEILNIRTKKEEVENKNTNIVRDTRRVLEVKPQGRIVVADSETRIATIDKGSADGIKRGMIFNVYSGSHAGKVLKGRIQIEVVGGAKSEAVILGPKMDLLWDPQTGWVAPDPRMRFSKYATAGQEETDVQELVKQTSRLDRIEAMRLEKIAKEKGLDAVDAEIREREAPSAPPVELGKGFVPMLAGDWINDPGYTPLLNTATYQKASEEELISMRDVNTGPLTFHFVEAIRTYRKEFLKRMCERNGCRTTKALTKEEMLILQKDPSAIDKVKDVMTSDVSYVVVKAGEDNLTAMEERLAAAKKSGKDEGTGDIKTLADTVECLKKAREIGATVISEDELEAFFTRRQRKLELLRGKSIQPGQNVFYVAGLTQQRSIAHTGRWIEDHGGVLSTTLDGNVDYVVVGSGLQPAFYEEVKRLGLKILREDELAKFFGVEDPNSVRLAPLPKPAPPAKNGTNGKKDKNVYVPPPPEIKVDLEPAKK